MRGQANLPALAVAVLALTAALGVSLAVVDGAFDGTDRAAADREAAVGLSDALVDPGGPLATRDNVLDGERVDAFDEAAFRDRYPGFDDREVAVRLDGETVVGTDDPIEGPSIERIVLVERRQAIDETPSLTGADAHAVTLPRRTDRLELRLEPPEGTTVSAVRVNDRVALRNESGLAGAFEVETSRYETVTLSLDATGELPDGSVGVTYYPTRTTKARLEVTVDG